GFSVRTGGVLVPRSSVAGSAGTTSVNPCVGTVPEDGVIVIHGLSDFAVNETGVAPPGRKIFCTTFVGVPISADALLFAAGGMMKIPMTFEYGPRSSLQELTPRTR